MLVDKRGIALTINRQLPNSTNSPKLWTIPNLQNRFYSISDSHIEAKQQWSWRPRSLANTTAPTHQSPSTWLSRAASSTSPPESPFTDRVGPTPCSPARMPAKLWPRWAKTKKISRPPSTASPTKRSVSSTIGKRSSKLSTLLLVVLLLEFSLNFLFMFMLYLCCKIWCDYCLMGFCKAVIFFKFGSCLWLYIHIYICDLGYFVRGWLNKLMMGFVLYWPWFWIFFAIFLSSEFCVCRLCGSMSLDSF